MVMSINEEISALEEQLTQTKGPGSVKKKEEIQAKIDDLQKTENPKPEKEKPLPPGVSEEDIPVIDTRPKPTVWVKVTDVQREKAEKEGKLHGFDPEKMIALIRD